MADCTVTVWSTRSRLLSGWRLVERTKASETLATKNKKTILFYVMPFEPSRIRSMLLLYCVVNSTCMKWMHFFSLVWDIPGEIKSKNFPMLSQQTRYLKFEGSNKSKLQTVWTLEWMKTITLAEKSYSYLAIYGKHGKYLINSSIFPGSASLISMTKLSYYIRLWDCARQKKHLLWPKKGFPLYT